MKLIVFLVEEPSMKEFLKVILPKVIPVNVSYTIIHHEGKQDLERSIPKKLRAFRQPDRLSNPAQVLKSLVPTYQKVSGARAVSKHMKLSENESYSFAVFIKGLQTVIGN